ncbi:hypothetical protein M432DRAFT_228808 [Thermoascus aurantiacus ATCC 26904]
MVNPHFCPFSLLSLLALHQNNFIMTREISWALQILLQASPESLVAHRFEVIPALREILRRVLVSFKVQSRQSEQGHATVGPSVQVSNDADDFRTDLTRGIPSPCSETASQSDHSAPSLAPDGDDDSTSAATVEEALTDDEATTPSDHSYKKFFKEIKKCIAEIEDISKRRPEDLITEVLVTLDGKDGRLTDIKQIVGKRNPSLEERFVQCLAQESIALEFTHWEWNELQVQQTRLDQLCCEPSSSQMKQTGCISQFVQHRFYNEEYSRKVVQYGLKQLVLKNRCQQELGCNGMGIEVGIASAYQTFSHMKYGQIPSFVLLLSTDGQAAPIQERVSGNPPSDSSGHTQPSQISVKDLLLGLSAWATRCYNVYCHK